jgi:energy-coupling factor transporter ATP-binding protein EcfA2
MNGVFGDHRRPGDGKFAAPPAISVRNLSKSLGQKPILSSVSFDIAEGELLVLLGPSGSGKTTLLRIMAGLDQPDAGEVYLPETRRRYGSKKKQYRYQPAVDVDWLTVLDDRGRGSTEGEPGSRARSSGCDTPGCYEESGGPGDRSAKIRSRTTPDNG